MNGRLLLIALLFATIGWSGYSVASPISRSRIAETAAVESPIFRSQHITLPARILDLFKQGRISEETGGTAIYGYGLGNAVESLCARHPFLKDAILEELFMGYQEGNFGQFVRQHRESAYDRVSVPGMKEFQRMSLAVREEERIAGHPSNTVVTVPDAKLSSFINLIDDLTERHAAAA